MRHRLALGWGSLTRPTRGLPPVVDLCPSLPRWHGRPRCSSSPGSGLTASRDDHPIGRLWWNHRIALRMLPFLPELSIEQVLKVILSRADVRLNTVERSGIMSRPRLAAAIVLGLLDDPALLRDEPRFRDFMKAINAQGGGIPFEVEAVSESEVRGFVARCASMV